MEDIDQVYHERIKATREEIWEACNSFITDHHVYLLGTIRANNRHILNL